MKDCLSKDFMVTKVSKNIITKNDLKKLILEEDCFSNLYWCEYDEIENHYSEKLYSIVSDVIKEKTNLQIEEKKNIELKQKEFVENKTKVETLKTNDIKPKLNPKIKTRSV